jgi:hypothetical protein
MHSKHTQTETPTKPAAFAKQMMGKRRWMVCLRVLLPLLEQRPVLLAQKCLRDNSGQGREGGRALVLIGFAESASSSLLQLLFLLSQRGSREV